SSFQRLQRLHECRPEMFVLPRQFQRLAQMRTVLVAIKARLIGRDLEQHAAGRAEIHREEIVAVDHWRQLITGIHQRFAHGELISTGRYGEGYVMYRPRPETSSGRPGKCFKIDEIRAIAAGPNETLDAAMSVASS